MMNTFAHNDSSACLSILLWSMFRILCFTFIHLKVKTRYYRLLTKREYLRYRNHVSVKAEDGLKRQRRYEILILEKS